MIQAPFIESTPLLKVSDMAENLIGSEIIKLASEVKAKIAAGENIYNCTIGDFDPKIFPIPDLLKNGIIDAYHADETNYPAANGIQELREAVSRFLHCRGGLEYNENQILIAGGARPLIYATFQTLLDADDTVIFPVPSWNNNHYSHLANAKQVFIETSKDNNFMPTADDIKPYISSANLITLCSPLNPTGTVFQANKLEAICDLILEENRKRGEMKKPVFLLYDQIYWTLNYGTNVHHDPVNLRSEMKNYTIYIDGISKAFAATGVRVGWGCGPQKVIDKMRVILSHIGAWAPKSEQVGTAKFLQNDEAIDTYLNSFKGKLEERLNAFYEGFIKLKSEGFKVDAIEPQASIYLTVQLNLQGLTTKEDEKLKNTQDITKFILDDAKIAMVPFSSFGAPKNSTWYRLSVGTTTMEDINGFFVNLRNSLASLK